MALPATPPAEPSRAGDRPLFAVSLRGYERGQVDEHLDRQEKATARLRAELADLREERDRAVARADASEEELREVRARPRGPAEPEQGFGFRAEKLLRIAEQEAADIRGSATRESTAIVEKARSEAEAHRHEVERTLISRASLLEQQAAQRTAGLQEREQQIADQLTAAREQAEQLHDNAARAAERLRQESEAAAEQTRRHAEADARRRADQAAKEVVRLEGLQSDVRGELGRLSELITAELAGSRGSSPARAATDPGPAGAAAGDPPAGAAPEGRPGTVRHGRRPARR